MSDLLKKKCVPCEGSVIPFDISQIHNYQKKVDGWNIFKNEKHIFFFDNYEFVIYRKVKHHPHMAHIFFLKDHSFEIKCSKLFDEFFIK